MAYFICSEGIKIGSDGGGDLERKRVSFKPQSKT